VNYRHAFHAGNFADVLKHAVLAFIIRYLQTKPGPIRIIETHAGAGLYDLGSEAAARTSEWKEGVGRMEAAFDAEAEAALAPYRDVLAAIRGKHGPRSYPGSPLIAQHMMRPSDAYVGAEMHPRTFAQLVDALGADRRCRVTETDGWRVLRAGTPPPERRGIILIDPAFESGDEWATATSEVLAAIRKWPTGCFMIWHPLKNPRQADDLARALRPASSHLLRAELMVDDLASAAKLAGCGLQIVNPPWTLEAALQRLLPQLAERLARSDRAGYRCDSEGG
jgi:23S rRNA (adenine2030-N6)-methyltransferase